MNQGNSIMRNTISVFILLLLLAGCQPPQPMEPTIPSSTPPVPSTATATLPDIPATATPEPAVSPTPGVTPSATPDTSLTPPMTREVAYAYWGAELLAFGGLDPIPGGCNPCGETWSWGLNEDGKYWTKRTPAHSPPARTQAAMTEGDRYQGIVLFGGAAGRQFFDDTWVWYGQDWTRAHPPISPSPRANARIVYDYANSQVVLWGGWRQEPGQAEDTYLSDTWTWDGQTWTQHEVPGPTNGAIAPASMAFDGNLHQVVLWQSGTGLWAWDGAAWHQQTMTNGPDPFTDGQIGFDATPFHSRLVLRGSTRDDPNPSARTWTFDGTTWTLVEDSTPTEGNFQDAQMVYDYIQQTPLFITPAGGKEGPFHLQMLAWSRTTATWVDAASYVPPPPPVREVNNLLYTSNRSDVAICVQVEDPAAKDAQAEFRETVQKLLETRLSQRPKWKEVYGQFPYRVDAGCPSDPHEYLIVEIPSQYKVHLYVVDAATAQNNVRLDMYEIFGEGLSDNFIPVTFALYVSPDEMRGDLSFLEGQLSTSLSLQQ